MRGLLSGLACARAADGNDIMMTAHSATGCRMRISGRARRTIRARTRRAPAAFARRIVPERLIEILLNEAFVQVHIDLHEGHGADVFELVNLPRFHDEDIART